MKIQAEPDEILALLSVPISAALGVLSVVVPAFFMDREANGVAPLFPIVHIGIEGFSIPVALSLFCVGFVTAVILKAPFWVIGPSSMIAFPVMAIAEVLVDPRSHTLFPFELLVYALLSLLATGGAMLAQGLMYVTRAVRRRFAGA